MVACAAGGKPVHKSVYYYTAEKLTGSRQVFAQEKVQTTRAMDSDELYLFDTVSQQPLQLLHFFRMMQSPRTEEIACYFFNRVEKEGVRWVSYHFERDADVVSPDPSVIDLIREAEQNVWNLPVDGKERQKQRSLRIRQPAWGSPSRTALACRRWKPRARDREELWAGTIRADL